MGKRKHRSCSSDDEKRKRSCSSSITTSSSADAMEHHATDRRNTTEDVGSDSQKQAASCREKELIKHKKRRKSTESEEKKKSKKKKAKKEHKKRKKHKSKRSRHSSPECFVPMPSASSAGTSELMKSKQVDEVGTRDDRAMMPMTKEQWEKERNTIRHVFDPETGRNRLVRGSGEILEEIVSKKRHAEINKQATFGDGIFYQFKAGLTSKSKSMTK